MEIEKRVLVVEDDLRSASVLKEIKNLNVIELGARAGIK